MSLYANEGMRLEVATGPTAPEEPVIAIGGAIDLANASELEARLDRLARETDRVVLDLSALEFLDSSGLAVLVRLHNRVADVRVVHPTPAVRRIIEITGLDEAFGLSD